MLTQEDLQAIRDVLHPLQQDIEYLKQNTATKSDVAGVTTRLEAIEGNMITQSYLEANNRVLIGLFKLELATFKQEIIEAMKVGFQEVVKYRADRDEEITVLKKQVEDLRTRLEKLEKQHAPHHS